MTRFRISEISITLKDLPLALDGVESLTSGTGNWFPLRMNAPAKIIHLTLRRA